jgi:nucleoside-diphosphate-sugar epimerase
MKALVTGAAGFVGTALTKHLVASGYDVRAMVRRESDLEKVRSYGAKEVLADLNDIESLRKAVVGVEVVFHIAALFRQADLPNSEFFRVNVEGTRNLLDVSVEAGVKNFIHCSTNGVHGHIENPPGDENSPYHPGDPYQVSKLEGEELVLSYVKAGKIKGSIIRPAMIYGENDTRFLKLFKGIKEGKFFYVGKGRALVHFIDVRDLAVSFRLAAETPEANGEAFLIAGESTMPLNEAVKIIADQMKVKEPWLHLPLKPMQNLGTLCELVCKPFGINPPLYRRRVDFFIKNRSFNCEKAHRILGFKPQKSFESELKDIIASYLESGAMK